MMPHLDTSDVRITMDYRLDKEIQGYYVYKSVWTPVLGQVLDVQAESTITDVTGMLSLYFRVVAWLNPQYKPHVENFKQILWLKVRLVFQKYNI